MKEMFSRPALILTDDPKLEEAVTRTLFTLQYRVDVAKADSEARQMAAKTNYLIIIASEEPQRNISTLAFYSRLKMDNPVYEQQVIFIAKDPSDQYLSTLHKEGCHYLTQPFEPADLVAEIELMREKGIVSENRVENRYNWTGECQLDGAGEYSGKTLDISMNGIKMYYMGEKVSEGDDITVHIPDIGYDGKATVKWSFNMGEKTILGLDLITNIDSETLKKAIPFAP